MTQQYIEIWHDQTSNPDDAAVWCVSVCDNDGEVRCLGWAATEELAREIAEEEAAASGLPLID